MSSNFKSIPIIDVSPLLSNKWGDVDNEGVSEVVKQLLIKLAKRQDLSRNILRGLALALGGCPEEFEGERAGDPFWVMRFIGYPGISDAKGLDVPENAVGW
ncbi:hypothetical protein C5167_013812 [Papaver somniferum]|uniref:Uncharacterized protein n=1 Tax=Papaver somniferum TaxID=3469 RepID=A0A4Y7J2C3_PAPSO|nr:hypothetical protein C5167_013812 [Papaver somniferum]